MATRKKKIPLLTADNICKSFSYPKKFDLLKNISLELCAGESLAIMGTSGVGKSTLLQILGTLEEPSSGTLTITGKNVAEYPLSSLRNQHIGFIFQAFNLLEDHTVLQNILMPGIIAKKETKKNSLSYNRAIELAKKVKVYDRLLFPAKLLSGGEKQRVAIARALFNDPEVLFADEPTGNLDEHTATTIQELLLNCVKELGKGLVIVTHDPALAKQCHKTYHLHEGKLT